MEFRSIEVQEIIGRVPSRIIRSGITVIFLTIVVFFLLSHFIRYPNLLEAKVVITTSPSPDFMVARASGNLILVKEENETISEGDLIAYLKSSAEPQAILLFESNLNKNVNISEINTNGSLGELKTIHSEVVNALVALNNFKLDRIFDIQVEQLNREVLTCKKLDLSLIRQQKLMSQGLLIAEEKFKVDSVKFIHKVITSIEFNAAQLVWLQQQHNARSLEIAIINNEAKLNQLKKEIVSTGIQKLEQQQKLELIVQEVRQNALAQIAKWKENYLFLAPAAGTLSYLAFFESGQFIESSKQCFSIVPKNGKLLGHAELPIQGSVKVGQYVSIRLDSYPFEQFGTVSGKISSISLRPGMNKFWVTVELPSQLLTSQGKTLSFKQQLTGTAQIITEDLRLWQRLFYQFRKILQAH
jgi:multidrug resistance efflux pump